MITWLKKAAVVFGVLFFSLAVVVGVAYFRSPIWKIEHNNDLIDRMEVEFNSHEMYLNIYVNRPVSCDMLVQSVGIESFIVKGTTYVPSCSIIDTTLVRITYTQEVPT
jgi:hypothetical protein